MNRHGIRTSLVITILISCLAQHVNTANILIISTLASPSHSLWFNILAKLLVEKQHQVTLLDTLNKGFTHPNLKRIGIEGAYDYGIRLNDLDLLAGRASLKDGIDLVHQFYTLSCEKIMFSPTIREFARDYEKKSFDLIIQDGSNCECMLGFVERLGRPPLVLATPFGSPQFVLHKAGNFDNPSYVPKHMTPFTQPLDFYQRLSNSLLSLYQAYLDNVPYTRHQNEIAKRFFGESLPPVEDIAKNATLFLVNTHVLLDGVRPTLPSVIPVGGFHITTSHTPLPQEVKSFLDGATEGAIYFSLGTNILSSDMSDAKRDMFLEAFREIPQRVLWKWNGEDIPNKSPNVMISKWFPQSDILAHSNVKAFISHGGLLGTQEAIYHGIPMVIMPFIVDQHTLSEKLSNNGVAIKLSFPDLTKNKLRDSLNQIINDPSYTNRMKEWSVLWRDRPQSGKDTALFWIEYVLRHPHSTHLRSPTIDMPLYQILLIDVISFILFIALLPITALYFSIRLLCRKKDSNKMKRQ